MSNFLKYIPWLGNTNKEDTNNEDLNNNNSNQTENENNNNNENKSSIDCLAPIFSSSDDSMDDSFFDDSTTNDDGNIEDQAIPSEEIVEKKFKREAIDANQINLFEKDLSIEKKWTMYLLLRRKRKTSKNPKLFIEIIDDYKNYSKDLQGLQTYLQNLQGLRTYASTGNLSWGISFMRNHGIESLFNALEMIKESSKPELTGIKAEQFRRILESLYYFADMKAGNQYLRSTYEKQPKESNYLRTLISYLTPKNEENNAVLIQLILALNETPSFASDCIQFLGEKKNNSKSGFEIISQIIAYRKEKEIEENKNKSSTATTSENSSAISSPRASTSSTTAATSNESSSALPSPRRTSSLSTAAVSKKDNLLPKYLIENICILIKALCLKSNDNLIEYFNLIINLHDSMIIGNLKPTPESIYDSQELYNKLSDLYKSCTKVFPKKKPQLSNPFNEEELIKYCYFTFNQSFMNIVLSLVDIHSNYSTNIINSNNNDNENENENSSFEEVSNYLQSFLLEYRYQHCKPNADSSIKLEDIAFNSLNEDHVQFNNPSPNTVQTQLFKLYEFYDKNWLTWADKTAQQPLVNIDENPEENLVTIDDYKKKVKKLEEKIDSLNRNLHALSKSTSSLEVISNLSSEFAQSLRSRNASDTLLIKQKSDSGLPLIGQLSLADEKATANSPLQPSLPPPIPDSLLKTPSLDEPPPPPPPPPPPLDAPPPPPPPPPPPGAPPPPPGAPPAPGSSSSKPNERPPKKMKPLFWTKVQQRDALESKWKDIDDSKVDVNFDLLESYFGATPTKSPIQSRSISENSSSQSDITSSNECNAKPKIVTLINDTKSRSVQIMIARFRLDINEVCDRIKMMRDDFTDDQLAAIKSNLPTDEEIQLLKNYDGDKKLLGICEKFFLKLIQINGLNYHIELLTLDRSIDQQIEDLNTPLDFIIKALDQINNSKRLEGVLSFILKIGNIMNGGGIRGGAYGFKIDLLTKIVDVKSSQKDYTMMTFLVDCFYRQKEEQINKNKINDDKDNDEHDPKDNNNNNIQNSNNEKDDDDDKKEEKRESYLLYFTDDLQEVLQASRVDLKFIKTDFAQLNSTIEQLKSYLPKALQDMANNDNYFSKFNEFQEKHLKDVQNVKEKLTHVDEIYEKTVKSFNEDTNKISYQDFINIFAKFIADYETELKCYLDKKEKEEKIKAQNMKKAKIEEFNRIMLEQQNAKNTGQPFDIESLSQRGIINNMLKTINQSGILNDNAANNESIIKNIQSKRSQRIKKLLNKK